MFFLLASRHKKYTSVRMVFIQLKANHFYKLSPMDKVLVPTTIPIANCQLKPFTGTSLNKNNSMLPSKPRHRTVQSSDNVVTRE